jgi:hypothetical protein
MKSPDSVNGVEARIEAGSSVNEARVSSFYYRASIRVSTTINDFESKIIRLTVTTLVSKQEARSKRLE